MFQALGRKNVFQFTGPRLTLEKLFHARFPLLISGRSEKLENKLGKKSAEILNESTGHSVI